LVDAHVADTIVVSMDDVPSRQKPIHYESMSGGCGISRRGFRLLLLLTFINTILLGATVAGPELHRFISAQWSQYQQRRAQRAAGAALAAQRAALAPVIQACLDFDWPKQQLLYAEDPDGIRAMTTQPTTDAVTIRPATAAPPACFSALPKTLPNFGLLVDPTKVVCFLHARKPAADADPLLVVGEFDPAAGMAAFVIVTLRPPSASDPDLAYRGYTSFRIEHRSKDGPLRVFSGHPHATDPSAFVIPYLLGSQAGEITGQIDRAGRAVMTSTGPLRLRQFGSGVAPP
jgi:hypothetical protein